MNQPISILGIPLDEQSSYLRGCAGGPAAIRKALACDSTNPFCESGFDVSAHSRIQDQGDLQLESGSRGRDQIAAAIGDLLQQNHKVLCLGGDHSVTASILPAMAEHFGPVNVLHLDAHPDLYPELNGNPHSHATPMYQALEGGWAKQMVQVGIRAMNDIQRDQARRFDQLRIVEMRDFDPSIRISYDGPTYLSIDLDVLDPAFAPGISHYEPGGISTRALIRVVQQLEAPVVGADIVELNPNRDFQHQTAYVAAKLMKEVLGKMVG